MSTAAFLLISTFLPSGLIGKAHAEQADHVVISQVFGGGGNSGAPYNKDFIELYNPTDQPIDLTNWSVQYASAAGTSWTVTPLDGTIPAHGYYLISEAGGANGVIFQLQMLRAQSLWLRRAGKVALFNNHAADSGATPAGAIDFVGYGSCKLV